MALRLRGLRPLRPARTVGDKLPRSARTGGRVAGCLVRERDFPTSVRPERRPKAGVEGPAMAAHDASTPRPAACGRCAQRERLGICRYVRGERLEGLPVA